MLPEILVIAEYAAPVAVAACLCWLGYKGHKQAGQLLILWVSALLIALPWLGVIPTTILVVIYGFIAAALLVVVAHALPDVLVLRARSNGLRRLLQETNRQLEEDRQKLVSTIHDEINAQLILAKLELEHLENSIDAPGDGSRYRSTLKASAVALRALLAAAYERGRDIINSSRAEVLDTLGFVHATENLVKHYAAVTHNIRFKYLPPADSSALEINKLQSANLFAILREAVLNAVKHADATEITVEITNKDGNLTLIVADNGVGVGPVPKSGLGLLAMEERAAAIGAECRLNSSTTGTVLRCVLPHKSID